MTGRRVEFIDFAKGLASLTVVWAHIMLVGWSHRLIYAFHMPFFFFASGLLFNREKYKSFGDFLLRRSRGMFLPYAIYSVVTWAVWALFRCLRHDAVESYIAPLLQTIWAQGSGEYMVHNSALWFIPCLFAVEIMYFFISRLGDTKALFVSFAIAFVGAALAHFLDRSYLHTLPWNLDAAFYALPFYCVANVFRQRVSLSAFEQAVAMKPAISIAGLVVLSFSLCVLAFAYGECSMGSSSYQCNIAVFLLRAFCGSFALILFSAMVVPYGKVLSECLKWCGRNSIHIMCTHIPIKGVAAMLFAKAFHQKIDVSRSYLASFVVFAVTMVAVWMIVRAIETVKRAHSA